MAHLRFLRRLVTVLTATMILGVLTIIVLLVIRLTATPPVVAVPDTLELPAGVVALAVTFGEGWTAVVTTDDRFLVFDNKTGALRQDVPVRTSE